MLSLKNVQLEKHSARTTLNWRSIQLEQRSAKETRNCINSQFLGTLSLKNAHFE